MKSIKSICISLTAVMFISGCAQKANTTLNLEVADEIPVEAAIKIVTASVKESKLTTPDKSIVGQATILVKGVNYCDTVGEDGITEYMEQFMPMAPSGEWSARYEELTAYAEKSIVDPFRHIDAYYLIVTKTDEDEKWSCYLYHRFIIDGKTGKSIDKRVSATENPTSEKEIIGEMSKTMTALKSLGVNVESSNAQ